MNTLHTPPIFPTHLLEKEAMTVPRYLRGRASLAIVKAMRAGRIPAIEVRAAMAKGESGMAELMYQYTPVLNVPDMPSPALEKHDFATPIEPERLDEIRAVLRQLFNEGDLSQSDIAGVKGLVGMDAWLKLWMTGLNRRIKRLTHDIPDVDSDYTPYSVIPTAISMEQSQMPRSFGEIEVELQQTPLIQWSYAGQAGAAIFKKVMEIMELIPGHYQLFMSMSETIELIGPWSFELYQDALPHYQVHGDNFTLYPEFVFNMLMQQLGDDDAIGSWLESFHAAMAEVKEIQEGSSESAAMSDQERATYTQLGVLLAYAERKPFSSMPLQSMHSEDGDFPAIYPLTSSMENLLEAELSMYGMEGVCKRYISTQTPDATNPLAVFDDAVRAIAIQTAMTRILIHE